MFEIRIAGKNNIGYGQEAVEYIKTPDGGLKTLNKPKFQSITLRFF